MIMEQTAVGNGKVIIIRIFWCRIDYSCFLCIKSWYQDAARAFEWLRTG